MGGPLFAEHQHNGIMHHFESPESTQVWQEMIKAEYAKMREPLAPDPMAPTMLAFFGMFGVGLVVGLIVGSAF